MDLKVLLVRWLVRVSWSKYVVSRFLDFPSLFPCPTCRRNIENGFSSSFIVTQSLLVVT